MVNGTLKDRALSTGNPELDKKLGGGIPVGSVTLIEGETDAGKSVLAQQMIWGCLKDNHTVTVLSTENTVKSLVNQMESLSWDISDHLLLRKLNIYPIKATRGMHGTGKSLENLLEAVYKQKGRDVVFIDSLTSFIAHSAVEQVISFFEECKMYCNEGSSMFMIAHSHAFDSATLVRINSMSDAHIRLTIENMGEKLVKTMEVSKVRGAKQTTGNVVVFDVEPNYGIKIIPFSKAKA